MVTILQNVSTEKGTVLAVLVHRVKLVQVCLVQLEALNRDHQIERSPSASCGTTLQIRAKLRLRERKQTRTFERKRRTRRNSKTGPWPGPLCRE